jgi:hypothetical protein
VASAEITLACPRSIDWSVVNWGFRKPSLLSLLVGINHCLRIRSIGGATAEQSGQQ